MFICDLVSGARLVDRFSQNLYPLLSLKEKYKVKLREALGKH
jgi:hypothetical protein